MDAKELPAHLRRRVLVSAAGVSSRTRAAHASFQLALGSLGATALGGWLLRHVSFSAVLSLREGLVEAGPVVFGVAASVLLRARRRGMLGPPLVHLVGITLAAPLLLLAGAIVSHLVVAGNAFTGPAAEHPPLVLLAAPMAVLVAIDRPATPGRLGWNGAALGAAAGAWMTAACGLTCPVTDLRHVVLEHLAFVPFAIAIGAALGLLLERYLRAR